MQVSKGALADAAKRGDLRRFFRDVYARESTIPTDPTQYHLFLARAHQVRSPQLVLSHESAALYHGLYLPNPAVAAGNRPRFIANDAPGRRSEPSSRILIRDLPDQDVVTDESGLRVTSPARTAVDLAAELALPHALMVTDCVARMTALIRHHPRELRGPLDSDLLAESTSPMRQAAKHAVTQRNRKRFSLALELTDPRHESPGESFVFGHMQLAGIPLPETQTPITTTEGTIYGDFGWPGFKLAAEVDGKVKYDTLAFINAAGENEAVVRQSHRESLIRSAGWDVIRWLFSAILRAPDRVIRQMWQRLEGRGWRPGHRLILH